MEQIISKEELNELIEIKGEVRGAALQTVRGYVEKKQGKSGLKKLDNAIANLDFEINGKSIMAYHFYHLKLLAAYGVVSQRLFGYVAEDFQNMGRFGSYLNPFLRLFAMFFASFEMMTKKAPRMWKQVFTSGELEIIEYDLKKKRETIRIYFDQTEIWREIFSHALEGFFAGVVGMLVNAEVDCKAIMRENDGVKYTDYLLEW